MRFDINNNYLAHYGILGQKWGVRRFQNEDGSLTNAGRKRYDVDSNDRMSKVGSAKYALDTKKYNEKESKQIKNYIKDRKKYERGKELYSDGKTIYSERKKASIRAVSTIALTRMAISTVNDLVNTNAISYNKGKAIVAALNASEIGALAVNSISTDYNIKSMSRYMYGYAPKHPEKLINK